jgi:hypothetical protein
MVASKPHPAPRETPEQGKAKLLKFTSDCPTLVIYLFIYLFIWCLYIENKRDVKKVLRDHACALDELNHIETFELATLNCNGDILKCSI